MPKLSPPEKFIRLVDRTIEESLRQATGKAPRSVTVYAPASISNLGAGFDVLGVALEAPGDFVDARVVDEPGLFFSAEANDHPLPADPKKNVAAHVASIMLTELSVSHGILLTLKKGMPVGSGLGSSAASSAAAAVAVNELLAEPLPKRELLPFVVEGERLASGSAHADNAAPCLFGGACLIREYEPLDVVSLSVKKNVWWVVVHPQLVVMTKTAREILPKIVPLEKAVRQWGNVGGLVAGLMKGDAGLIGRSMKDVIIEPARAPLIQGFEAIKAAALRAGAAGCAISGSGPAMLSVARTRKEAETIGKAMVKAFREYAGVKSIAYISQTNLHGARKVRR